MKAFVNKLKLYMYGVDVIITSEGKHLIIDCNYFSSYTNIDNALLANKFDSLFEEIKPKLLVSKSYPVFEIGLACCGLALSLYWYRKHYC